MSETLETQRLSDELSSIVQRLMRDDGRSGNSLHLQLVDLVLENQQDIVAALEFAEAAKATA